MVEFKISKYGNNFTQEDDVKDIPNQIISLLNNEESIILDCSDVIVMSTTAVKAILKPIAKKYGYENLFNKILFKNTTEDLQVVIGIAVEYLQSDVKD